MWCTKDSNRFRGINLSLCFYTDILHLICNNTTSLRPIQIQVLGQCTGMMGICKYLSSFKSRVVIQNIQTLNHQNQNKYEHKFYSINSYQNRLCNWLIGNTLILYTNIDQTLVNLLHRLLNCEIGELDCHYIVLLQQSIYLVSIV